MTKLAVAVVLLTALHATARGDDHETEVPPAPRLFQPEPQPPPPEEITNVGLDRPVPAGYTPVMRRHNPLIIAGAVILGTSYLVSVGVAAAPTGGAGVNTLIPIAGPFISAAQGARQPAFLIAALGAPQVAGAVMLGLGIWWKKRVFVRNDLIGSLRVSPIAAPGAAGMVLSGRF